MTDRTSKILLISIAIALWGLLLRSVFTTPIAKADDSSVQIVSSNGILFVVRNGKFVNAYKLDKDSSSVTSSGSSLIP